MNVGDSEIQDYDNSESFDFFFSGLLICDHENFGVLRLRSDRASWAMWVSIHFNSKVCFFGAIFVLGGGVVVVEFWGVPRVVDLA